MRRDNTQRPRPASEGGLRKKSKNSSSGAKVHLEQTFMSELKLRPTMPGTFSANCRKAGPTKAKAAARRTTGKGTGLPLLLRPSRRWTLQRQKRNGKTADLKFGHYTIRKDGNKTRRSCGHGRAACCVPTRTARAVARGERGDPYRRGWRSGEFGWRRRRPGRRRGFWSGAIFSGT